MTNVKLKIEPWIIAVGIIVTSSVWSMQTVHVSHIVRYISWCCVNLILLGVLIVRGSIDFSILRKRIFIAFGYLILISSISYVAAINFGEWFFDVSRLILMAIYLFCAVQCLSEIKEIAKPMVLTAIGLSVYGIWKTEGGAIMPAYIANMGSRPLFALYLLLLLPFCLVVDGPWRKWGTLGAILIIVNVFTVNSRAAMVALITASLLTAAVFNRRALCAVLVIVILAGVYISFDSDLWERIGNSESAYSRFAMWKQSLKMTNDKFLVGAGNWKFAILPYSTGFLEKNIGYSMFCIEPHNIYLHVLAETSIFGLIAYLFMFCTALYYTVKSNNPYVFMGIIIYMVFSFFSNKLRAPQLMLVMTFFALSITGSYKLKHTQIRCPLYIASVIVMIFLCAYSLRYDMERRFKSSQVAKELHDPNEEARQLSYIPIFATIEKETTIPYVWFRGDANKRKKDFANATKDFAKAYEQNPNNLFVLNSQGEALFYAGRIDDSLNMYKRSLEIRPGEAIATQNVKIIEDMR